MLDHSFQYVPLSYMLVQSAVQLNIITYGTPEQKKITSADVVLREKSSRNVGLEKNYKNTTYVTEHSLFFVLV